MHRCDYAHSVKLRPRLNLIGGQRHVCLLFSFLFDRQSSIQTKIRIKFTDGTQVEKVFLSTNKIKAVYNFVRGCLREEVKTVMFTLCNASPC